MSKRRAEAVAMMNAESNKFRLRAERAEAAIQRVRDVYYGPVGLLDTRIQQIGDILRALDGDGDA